jgi:hypothetical protein
MNKAFTREPDSDDVLCPRCGARGDDVQRETVEALARPEAAARLAPTASYCPTPTCDVVYFDAFERVVTTAEILRPVYPKDADAPICPCFGVTTDPIDQDLAENTVERTRQLVAQSKSPEAHCLTAAPHGRSCAAEVQRYYMQRRGGA